jgi:hypothetical protein
MSETSNVSISLSADDHDECITTEKLNHTATVDLNASNIHKATTTTKEEAAAAAAAAEATTTTTIESIVPPASSTKLTTTTTTNNKSTKVHTLRFMTQHKESSTTLTRRKLNKDNYEDDIDDAVTQLNDDYRRHQQQQKEDGEHDQFDLLNDDEKDINYQTIDDEHCPKSLPKFPDVPSCMWYVKLKISTFPKTKGVQCWFCSLILHLKISQTIIHKFSI